jgi:hypothetical protein
VGVDAIDTTDAAIAGGTAAASTTDKPKWYILDLTETRVLKKNFAISKMPITSLTNSHACRSSSNNEDLPLNHYLPNPLPESKLAI